MFFHFGMNTFTNSEWGTGSESPSLFNPKALDTSQWMDVAIDAGVSLAILVAKHHDGFSMWPSAYTTHSVKHSPWKDGKGDVVREFTNAAKARGIDVGLYLSPWDRHERCYGLEEEYNEYYLAQLQELLSRYGSVWEIWFDGAKGVKAKNMTYHFQDWFQKTKQMQSTVNIFSDAGPDIRWVGDEQGYAGTTNWSPINQSLLRIGDSNMAKYLNSGDEMGTDWVPTECDVSIRKGWFWHKNEEPKLLKQLLNIYYNSVGRNCVLLLNVPPNSTGLVSEHDIIRLKEFRKAIDTIFAINLAAEDKGSVVKASTQRGGVNSEDFHPRNVLKNDDKSYWAPKDSVNGEHWIEIEWRDETVEFNVIRLQEAIWMGQRVQTHEIYADGNKVLIANGTTIGYKRLYRMARVVKARKLRIVIKKWRIHNKFDGPLLSAVGVHFDPY